MNKSQEKAIELLDEFGIDDIQNIDIKDLVYAKGIIYRETPLENYDGRIVFANHGKALITINSNLIYPPRKRFTIAHELGHFVLGHNRRLIVNDNEASLSYYKSGHQETEANQFASELLMPTDMFLKDIEGETFSPQLMFDLSEEYKTSVTSVVFKYLEYGNYPIVVFYSYNGRVLYWKKSKEYNRRVIDYSKLPVPHNSVAEEWYTQKVQYSSDDIQNVRLGVWFSLWGQEDGWCHEFCIVSPRYNTVLSIVWED